MQWVILQRKGVRRDRKKSCCIPKAILATAKSLLTDVYLLVLQEKQGGRVKTIYFSAEL